MFSPSYPCLESRTVLKEPTVLVQLAVNRHIKVESKAVLWDKPRKGEENVGLERDNLRGQQFQKNQGRHILCQLTLYFLSDVRLR